MTWNAKETSKTVSINGNSFEVENTEELIEKIQEVASDLGISRFKVYVGSFEIIDTACMDLANVTDNITITPYDKAA